MLNRLIIVSYAIRVLPKISPSIEQCWEIFDKNWEAWIFNKKKIYTLYRFTLEKIEDEFKDEVPYLLSELVVVYVLLLWIKRKCKFDSAQTKKISLILAEIIKEEKKEAAKRINLWPF